MSKSQVRRLAAMRPTWDEYFLNIAKAVATRADCSRAQVGAVIVKDNRIVSTGYNGAPAGEPGCLSAGACPRANLQNPPVGNYDGCIAVHAEANAIIYGDYEKLRGATIYVAGWQGVCINCEKLIRAAGITRIISA